MARKSRNRTVVKFIYFYLNNDLHKVLRKSRPEDLLIAWNYSEGKRVAYSLQDVMKRKQHAYLVSQVSKLINRHEDTIKRHLYAGNIKFPQQSYSLNGNKTPGKYFWSEDDIRELHNFFKTVHRGRPRVDGKITPGDMPSKAELEAMINQETVLYAKNEDGTFYPVWKQPEW
jgi:hypothetical protein